MNTLIKKTLIVAVASGTFLATTTMSSVAADENAPFDGGYIGGAITNNKANTNASVTPSSGITLGSKSKIGGGLYAGYGKQMEQLYFGVEGAFYLNRNATPTASFGTTNSGLKSRNTFDVSARAGFVADQALFYGLAGYTSTNFETIGLAANTSKRLNGLRYGGGVEFAVTPEMSIRGEYTHANYKEWNVASGASTINFDPSEHRFLLGASLRF